MKKNEVLECLKTRRSIRAFDPEKVPSKEIVARVAEAGTYAPTGMGKQSPVIVAVMDRAVRDRLSKMNADVLGSASDPFYGAPVVLVVLADRSRPTYMYDGALVMGNLLNAAHALGLGSCWIHLSRRTGSPETMGHRGGLRGYRTLHPRLSSGQQGACSRSTQGRLRPFYLNL